MSTLFRTAHSLLGYSSKKVVLSPGDPQKTGSAPEVRHQILYTTVAEHSAPLGSDYAYMEEYKRTEPPLGIIIVAVLQSVPQKHFLN